MDNISYVVGYKGIIDLLGLDDLPRHCTSYILESGSRRTREKAGRIDEFYTKSYAPGDNIFDQLVFCLKYEGINLLILKRAFEKISASDLSAFIQSKPTGRYHRKLWYLYENLKLEKLELPDLKQGNYIDLVDPKKYFTGKATQIQRQRINDNLLGTFAFSPYVRRSQAIENYLAEDFKGKCQRIIDEYPKELIRDALAYLYTQETRSSFNIEQETLSGDKQERFMQLLQEADHQDYLNKPALIDLQKKIIPDSRLQRDDYRDTQEYVSSSTFSAPVHLVPPRPKDLNELMDGLNEAAVRMQESNISPVIVAAVIAFGFVYIHPFKDGNGRIHRFLIHHILSRMEFTPKDFVFPVSAVMYQDAAKYQDTLNLFSKPLLQLVNYSLDHEGFMTVHDETIDYYRYFDATGIVENLFWFIGHTIDTEYLTELDFLKKFATAKNAVEGIIDGLSQREARLFVDVCKDNNFRIGSKKRKKYFDILTDDEIHRMEDAVKASFAE